MNERWKPENYERYWVIAFSEVVQSEWRADCADLIRWRMGNCFKTKEKAEAAAEKVKALLLSLHDNDENLQETIQDKITTTCQAMDKGKENVEKATCTFGNLPKLSTEVFDYPDCPKWAEYAAVNQDGGAFFYRHKPAIHCAIGWSYYAPCYGSDPWKNIPGTWDASDWQNSLIERPVKETALPEWCKVGEWVYHDSDGYYYTVKSIAIENDNVQISDGKREYTYTANEIKTFFSRAHLRPYNADEMRGLVGKVVTTSSGRHCTLVTACKQKYSVIEPQVMLNNWLYATDLLHGGNTIDGKPCGVFEHLENGEWVE